MRVAVIGAGIAGLSCALELAERGAAVEVLERAPRLGAGACSWFAGGMLAPWCERENSEALIAQLGVESIPWWQQRFTGTVSNGTLVVAHARDTAELSQFGRRTEHFAVLEAAALGALEPDLAGRFGTGLYFAEEAHLDPRAALAALAARLGLLGVAIRFGCPPDAAARSGARAVIDCSGLAAAQALPRLRGVKGEMLLLELKDFTLKRPVRVLHPRLPLYVVPRGAGVFMVGATLLESDDSVRISARSMLELLSAAYALHPAFGEAHIVEIGTAVRAAFPDNLPRLVVRGNTVFVNGLYRHGFLVAPAMAQRAARVVLEGAHFPEVMDEDPRQRRLA
jgi:glycine oxidase